MALQYVLPFRWLGGLEGRRGRPEYNRRVRSLPTLTKYCPLVIIDHQSTWLTGQGEAFLYCHKGNSAYR